MFHANESCAFRWIASAPTLCLIDGVLDQMIEAKEPQAVRALHQDPVTPIPQPETKSAVITLDSPSRRKAQSGEPWNRRGRCSARAAL